MAEMLASSLLWRVLLAIGGWFSALAHSSRIFAWLGRTWRASKTRAWLLRRLSASDAPTRESWSAKRFARLNARLAARHGLKDCLDDSVLCRIWRFFVRCGQNSRLFSWLFSDGLHGVILFALSTRRCFCLRCSRRRCLSRCRCRRCSRCLTVCALRLRSTGGCHCCRCAGRTGCGCRGGRALRRDALARNISVRHSVYGCRGRGLNGRRLIR